MANQLLREINKIEQKLNQRIEKKRKDMQDIREEDASIEYADDINSLEDLRSNNACPYLESINTTLQYWVDDSMDYTSYDAGYYK